VHCTNITFKMLLTKDTNFEASDLISSIHCAIVNIQARLSFLQPVRGSCFNDFMEANCHCGVTVLIT